MNNNENKQLLTFIFAKTVMSIFHEKKTNIKNNDENKQKLAFIFAKKCTHRS